ncbi:unnamed protein product [Prorocentrum cordatum]|uniref:Uncharacterized protein n=1 Tax=Prorocentrum cordatum TaxID=2364126 RepID=A0ABN9WYC9_9DINO|nr:unnamed protein product [Polarella glacialis]
MVSVITYGWFILGVVWLLNSTYCKPCPGLYRLSLAVIFTAIARLLMTLIILEAGSHARRRRRHTCIDMRFRRSARISWIGAGPTWRRLQRRTWRAPRARYGCPGPI